MIDVVFLLIIFFLVSSHLAKQDSQLDLKLPIAQSGADDLQQDTPRVTINVKPDGSLWMTGRLIDPQQLVLRLEDAKSREGGNLEVRIRGSRTAPYSTVEPVMIACTKAGVWNVTYAVFREEPQ
jgi:biopolymer transport protein ExbD